MTLAPERVERGQGHVALGGALAGTVVEVAQPLIFVAILGERRLAAQPPSQPTVDIVIVAGLADRLDGLFHRQDKPVARRRADVVAL